jgi:hypothetical protein
MVGRGREEFTAEGTGVPQRERRVRRNRHGGETQEKEEWSEAELGMMPRALRRGLRKR